MSAPRNGSPSRFVRLARLCNRHRWRTFGAWVLALVAIQVVASAVGVKEISSFRLPGTESANRARIEASLKRVAADDHVAAVTSPFGAGGRLTDDGRIGVATLLYKESTNDITPADLEHIQDVAFAARS